MYAENDKDNALEDQRNLFRRIGGPEFRHTLDEYEKKGEKDRDEIASMEDYLMNTRREAAGEGGYLQLSHQAVSLLPQARKSGMTQAWANSLPDPSTFSPVPSNPPTTKSEASTRGHSPTKTAAPTRSPQVIIPPQVLTVGRNRSSTLNLATQQYLALHQSVLPTKGPSAMGPPRLPGLRNNEPEAPRHVSPFYCQDCGELFTVRTIADYESHRNMCKVKEKRAGVETGDLKAIGLARKTTVSDAVGGRRAFGLHSMPNLHAPLAKVGLQGTGKQIPPLKFPPFQFPPRAPVPKDQTKEAETSDKFPKKH